MFDGSDLYSAILTGNAKRAGEVTKTAMEEKVDPSELVQKYMIPAMDEVGRRFECNKYFVPELLIAARAMKISLELITPYLVAQGAEPAGRVVIGTVQGDLHDIGKNLVTAVLEGAGFLVHDLGVDVPASRFVEAVKEKAPDILALSALLTVTLPAMKNTLEALERAQVRHRVKVMVGGAPVTRQYAEQIGADAYSDNAFGAVKLARTLMGNL